MDDVGNTAAISDPLSRTSWGFGAKTLDQTLPPVSGCKIWFMPRIQHPRLRVSDYKIRQSDPVDVEDTAFHILTFGGVPVATRE